MKANGLKVVIISPWKTFEQTYIPFIQECFVPSLVEICHNGLGDDDFYTTTSLFRSYIPLEKGTVFYLKFVPSLIENWLSGSKSGEEF